MSQRLSPHRAGEVYAEIGGRDHLLAEVARRVIEAVNLADKATCGHCITPLQQYDRRSERVKEIMAKL